MDVTTLLIAGFSVLAVLVIFIVMPILIKLAKQNNIPVDTLLNSSEQIMQIVQTVVKSLNLTPETKALLDLIAQSALIGVRYAEQLYKSGQLPADQRKPAAVDFVKQALIDAKVEITPERENLISAIIESAVYLLPKTHDEEVKTEPVTEKPVEPQQPEQVETKTENQV